MAGIVCNTRVLGGRLTGVQRYTGEILSFLEGQIDTLAPNPVSNGLAGHLWEQSVLPLKVNGRLLWSPSNTGPVAVRHQVVTIHDVVPFDMPETLQKNFVSWYQFLQPKLLHRVEGIITVSHFTRERLLERMPLLEDKTTVVHNGVDDRFVPQSEEAISNAVHALGIPSKRYVLCVGSLEPRKNLKRLIDAWARILNRLPDDVWLVLAGGRGSERIFGSVETGKLPARVHLTGHVPDENLPALMSGAISFLYPSYYEGFGLPPLEAMACGTATLTGNKSCLPEIVGDAALKVDPYDVDAISDGICNLIEDTQLRTTLEADGIVRARQFSWQRAARETMRALEKYT